MTKLLNYCWTLRMGASLSKIGRFISRYDQRPAATRPAIAASSFTTLASKSVFLSSTKVFSKCSRSIWVAVRAGGAGAGVAGGNVARGAAVEGAAVVGAAVVVAWPIRVWNQDMMVAKKNFGSLSIE